MLIIRTLTPALLLFANLFCNAANETPSPKQGNKITAVKNNSTSISYTVHLDNKLNKNKPVDSVWVILDKYDRTGAGVVKKVFYPNAGNEFIIDDLPAGKYYAEIYVLGAYKKHFSGIITSGKTKNNKARFSLDKKDYYITGNADIPAENTSLFAFNKK